MNDSNNLQENEVAAESSERGLLDMNNTPSTVATSSDVVYSSYCAYSPLITWMLLVAPITTIACGFLVWFGEDYPPAERESAIKILFGTTVGVLVLYLFILPFRVIVKSDGSICVRVPLMTYTFAGIVRAYQSPGMWEDAFLPRFKFATNESRRVIILRRKGMWDLTVSPTKPQEFVDAVSNVMTALETQAGVS